MDDRVAVVGDDGVVEHQLPDVRQFLNVRRSRKAGPVVVPSSVTSMLNVSVRFGDGIALVEDVRHHLVAEIEVVPWNPRLIRRDEQAHELGRARRIAVRLSQLRDRVQLTDARLLIDAPEHQTHRQQDRHTGSRGAWRVVSGALRSSASLMNRSLRRRCPPAS